MITSATYYYSLFCFKTRRTKHVTKVKRAIKVQSVGELFITQPDDYYAMYQNFGVEVAKARPVIAEGVVDEKKTKVRSKGKKTKSRGVEVETEAIPITRNPPIVTAKVAEEVVEFEQLFTGNKAGVEELYGPAASEIPSSKKKTKKMKKKPNKSEYDY